MSNKKYVQPFDIIDWSLSKGEIWAFNEVSGNYKSKTRGCMLPIEIVESWEEYKEPPKLEDLPKVTIHELFNEYNSSIYSMSNFMKNNYHNGLIILPE